MSTRLLPAVLLAGILTQVSCSVTEAPGRAAGPADQAEADEQASATAQPRDPTPAGGPGMYLLDAWAVDPSHPDIEWILFCADDELVLGEDGTFTLLPGGERGPRHSGTWSRVSGAVLLRTTEIDSVPTEERTQRCRIADGHLMYPCTESEDGVVEAPFRCRGIADSEFLALSPAERAIRIRSGLPEPTAEGGFRFALVEYTLAGRVASRLTVAVAPDVFEGRTVWKVIVRERTGDETRSLRTTWLDRELRLLRTEGENEHVRSVQDGFEVRSPDSKGKDVVRIDASAAATTTHAGLLLFLRSCPADDMEYEIPIWDSRTRSVSMREVVVSRELWSASRGASCRRALSAEVTRDEGDIVIEERFGVTAEDRRPVFHSAGAFSGVGAAGIFLVNPDLVGPTDLLGISDPPRSPDEAAMAFAFGCLLGDEALVDRVVDWDAVLAASADAFSPSLPPTRGEAREALRRFRKGLLPAEIEQVVGTIRTKRHVLEAQRQEDLYYVLPGVIAADFDCAAAPHGDDWRIVRIRKSLLRGQRHDLGLYPEERLDALARKGLRFWMWARYVEEHPDYPSALEDLAEFGDRALPILEQRASGGDRSAALCLAGLGRKGLDPLLEAWRRASESDRRMIGGYIEELIAREGATPEQHAQATEPLLARLSDRGGSLSARILARRGEPIVEALLAVISDGDAVARKNCLLALARIGPPARAADSAVVALVDDPDPQVARRAKDARFSLRHPHISFRVDSQSGIPKVSLYRDGRPVRPNPRTALSPLLERGEVRLIGLPAGRFDLLIEAQYPTPPAVLLDVVLGEEVTELGRVSFPEGTVIRIDPGPDAPKPLPTIGVRAVRRGRVRYERGTFLNVERPGGLCLPPLGPGTFELVIYLTGGRGRTLLRQDIEVTGKGDLTIPIDWSAAPEK